MRRRIAVCSFLLVASMLADPLWALAADIPASDLLAIGRRIYREGVLPSGQTLQGQAAANVSLTGMRAACVTCHRRSGYGSSEGTIEVRPITGPALFGERVAPTAPEQALGLAEPPVGSTLGVASSRAGTARESARRLRAARAEAFAGLRPRPTYDEPALARAIRDGIDVTGHAMSPAMPRYALTPDELAALGAYLKTLSAQTAPGVTDESVHFATVIQPGVSPQRRQALVDVLQAFMQDRNLSLRVEARREMTGMVQLKRVYRDWVLHVWELKGPPDTWEAQLEAYNRRQPVFALLSGLGDSSWREIHAFSERFEVPCIFPQVDLPVLSEHDFYTVYLSRGMTLEGQALAKFLLHENRIAPVIQLLARDEASSTAAAAFRQAWLSDGGTQLVDQVLDAPPDVAFWQQLAAAAPQANVVLWLSKQYMKDIPELEANSSKKTAVYLSASLGWDMPDRQVTAAHAAAVRMVLPQDPPALREARLATVKRWLQSKGLALTDEKLQMNAYLAATVTGMVMSHSKDTYSREFLLERLEHRLGTALEPSIYPRLSLGPGQRYASKGSYVVALAGPGEGQWVPVSDWLVP